MSSPARILLLAETADWGASVRAALEESGASLRVDVETDSHVVDSGIDTERVDALLVDDAIETELTGFLEDVRTANPTLPIVLCVGDSSETADRRDGESDTNTNDPINASVSDVIDASDAIDAGVTDVVDRERVAAGSAIATNRLRRLTNTPQVDDETDVGAATRGRSVFVTHSPLGFIELDHAFRIAGVNPAAESILGDEAAALRGESWRTLVAEREHEAVAGCLAKLRETAGHSAETLPLRRADGEERLCRCHIRVVEDETGSVTAAFVQFQDVTKQHETERQLAEYASTLTQLQRTTETLLGAETPAEAADIVVDSLTEVFEFDIAGVWLANDDGTALEPVSMTEPGKQLIAEPPTYSAANPSLSWNAFTEGTSRLVEDMQRETERHNPETPIESELIVPLGAYGVLNIGSQTPGGFSRQDLHRLEGWAKTVTAALARIEQLTTLTERERELERERNRLDAFTSTVTHDLRNPLMVASGRLDLLAADCDSEHLPPIERALDRMEGLIEEMIQLARQGERVGETEWVDLGSVPGECWQNVETGAATITSEADAVIDADRSRLSGLFENLFRNAIDHGGETVEITVGLLADGEGFYVADDGAGINDADIDRLFERGYSTDPEGTGYGLAIVNEIAEAHGWTIAVTESESGGARFEIRGVEFRED